MQLSIAGYKLLDSACGCDAPAQEMRRAAAAVKRAAKALRDLDQAIEEEQVVVVSEEARLAVVAALDDVEGNPVTRSRSRRAMQVQRTSRTTR